MSNEVKNVSVGKPMVGGAVFRAPIGTTLPTNASSALSNVFNNMGYISEEGVKNNNSRETTEIKAWGGDTVLQPQTSKTDTFGMTFLESINLEVLKAIYGEDNVSGTLTAGMEIKSNSSELDYAVWVIDMILTDGVLKRIVIPNGKITEVGEIVYKDDEPIGFESTITAFPGSDGDSHKEYIVAPSQGGNSSGGGSGSGD